MSQATVLAVGTELTTGQITNRNAAWISEKLVNLGINVLLHETVPDDRPLIQQALNRCAAAGPLIFVTGGLGPTTDDFTREVVAQWLNRSLRFHESIWNQMSQRLKDMGILVAGSNKQQCLFPEGATILPNPVGTAAGFMAEFPHVNGATGKIWVFPGPPGELAKVWEQGVEKTLRETYPTLKPLKLLTWQCMGKSEAELGELTEEVLAGSGLLTGYRAHRPYVEIKVWCPEDLLAEKSPWIRKLEQALSPWMMTKQAEDLAEKLLRALERFDSIEIIDSGTGGILNHRLGVLLRESQHQNLAEAVTFATEWSSPEAPEAWLSNVLQQADAESITLVLTGFTPDGTGIVGMRDGDRFYEKQIQTPYRHPELIDRMRHYLTEMALKFWCEWLDSSVV